MICVIGNSPSSGSTLLADLLDSSPVTACGPETSIFANSHVYRFGKHRKNVLRNSTPASIYKASNRIYFHNLENYGLSKKEYAEFVKNFNNIREFGEALSERFFHLREMEDPKIMFEKSPENISTIAEYLDAFPDGKFIHIVRNPLYVFRSMRKRGFSEYTSLLTWLFEVAHYFPYADNPQVKLVTYEDLVESPFELSADIINWCLESEEVTPEIIEKQYATNEFRNQSQNVVKSWSVTNKGTVLNANKALTEDEKQIFSQVLNVKIDPGYAKLFDIPDISFESAIKHFGYHKEIKEELKGIEIIDSLPKPSIADRMFFFKKYLLGLWHRNINWKEGTKIFSPITNS